MASSPSEFLTFYRRMSASRSLRTTAVQSTRPFSISTRQFLADGKRNTGDLGDNNRIIHEKREDKDPNVQAYESSKGIENRQKSTGGHATEQRDSTDSKAQVKKDFPEAPTTIGMEDERGGKGV